MTTQRNTRYIQKYREKKKGLGVCIYGGCWTPALPDRVLCNVHAARDSAYLRKRRHHRKVQGLCTKCNAPAVANRALCAAHLEYQRRRHYAATKRRSMQESGVNVSGGKIRSKEDKQ